MSKKLLQLFSAKHVTTHTAPRHHVWIRYVATAFGLFVVLVGAASVMTNLAHSTLGSNAARDIFAPAIAVTNPGALASLQGPTLTHDTATTTPITPAHLVISSIGVNANVEQVGKKADGSMGTPSTFGNVGWYALGSKPGEAGNAVIDGHVNNALTTAGVFAHLSQITIGDIVQVSDAAGKTLIYKVTKVQTFAADSAPDASVFATTGPSQLVLITCDGDWVASAHSFDKRLVVFASLSN